MARASMERQVNGAMKGRSIFRDEKGSTTAGMAVALLVTLSLLFSAAQVYRIHAAGSEVQEVADAAACAALNPVAEFMVAVRVADAAVLSLTLLGDIAYGAGVVALCVPPAAELGSQLVSAGQKVLKARDALSQKACEGLGALQRALPFLAAANGAAVAAANGEGSGYAAMALLLPGEGSSIASGASAVEESMEEAVEAGKGELAEAAGRAEETVENKGGDGEAVIRVARGVFIFENSTSGKITAAEVLGPCYIEDDQTVTKTATSASVAGLVIRVDGEGVAVEMGFGYTPATAGA